MPGHRQNRKKGKSKDGRHKVEKECIVEPETPHDLDEVMQRAGRIVKIAHEAMKHQKRRYNQQRLN